MSFMLNDNIQFKNLIRSFGLALLVLSATSALAAVPLSDTAVSDAIQDEFKADMAVPAALIDIVTDQGVVTLTGTTSSILAKERATRIAETVKGVRSVINRIKVAPTTNRSDNLIEADIISALAMDPAADSYEVDVSVDRGRVTLTGAVDSWQEKKLCAQVAKNVRGVLELKNDIEVNYKTFRPDNEIKPEIEKALQWNTLVDNSLIDVEVKDGKVELSGIVGSAAEKSQARILAYVSGVRDVNADKLKVERWMRDKDLRKHKYSDKSDEQITEAVKDAFLYDPRVVSFNIDVTTDNGIVTLRGRVDNLKAKHAALRDAKNTVGVGFVIDRLQVRPKAKIDDATIEKRIRQAFRRNPYIENLDLTVISINGLVDLYGAVDTYFEKAKAEDLAGRVNGVIAVDNNIDVSWATTPFPYDPYADTWRDYNYSWYRTPLSNGPPSFSEAFLEKEIKDELFWSPFVDADQVKVSVNGSVATLEGKVDSWSEYTAAAENAYEGGATVVINNLAVK